VISEEKMVMTILEGRVEKDHWPTLEQAYKQGSQYQEAGLVQSFLIHSSKEPDLWRIITLWSSREALEAMRQSTETPRGVLMFRQAHTEPQLSIFEVVQQIKPV
jgi:heme-degrading monooxygenase HmoA